MKSLHSFKNKNILITGGTSGLGQELSLQLKEAGAQVAIIARNKPKTEIKGLQFIQGDVGDKMQTHRIFAEALSKLGSIDILINNASTLGVTPLRLLLDTECETLESTFETNVLGPFRLTKLAVPAMILNQFGIVVNISSDAAVNAYPTWGAYGVSKAALAHLTRIFQAELEGSHVSFFALDPGDMDTPLHLAAVPTADRQSLNQPKDSARAILERIL